MMLLGLVLPGSMEPAFLEGDLSVIRKKADYAVGDVVTFWIGGALTAHRILENSQEDFAAKGDENNAVYSQILPCAQVVSKALLTVAKMRRVFMLLRISAGDDTPAGISPHVFT